jgi:hypothetical protein
MARSKRPASAAANSVVLFNVVYQDGSQTSNRKVPGSELNGFDGDAPARSFIEAQDRDIALKSGQPRGPIKSITRSPVR